MFFRRNRAVEEALGFYVPEKVDSKTQKEEIKKALDLITSCLTPTQLKAFEINTQEKIFTFRDRIEIHYEDMWPIYSLEVIKQFVEAKVEDYKELFGISTASRWDWHFIEELESLFEKKPGTFKKRFNKFDKKYS